MLLGSIFALLSGLALPLVLLVYGYTVDEFTSYDFFEVLQGGNSSVPFFCSPEDVISEQYLDSTDVTETLKTQVQYFMYYTLGLAVIVLVSSFLARLLWAITGSKQALRMRLTFFEAVLTRHVGWYDTNTKSTAEIPSHFSR